MSSSTSVDHGSCWNSGSGRGKALEQSQGVMASSEDSTEAENISSLMHNDVGGVLREDTTFKNQFNGAITEELKASNETETVLEASNEEICLAKEFGAAKLLGSGKRTTKNHRARDNISDKSQFNKSRATPEARVHEPKATRATPTWTRRERNQLRDNMAVSS